MPPPRGAEWGLPLAYLLWSRGGCLERGVLAFMLGVRPAALRRMVWGLRRRGLVEEREGGRVCITPRGVEALRGLRAAARKRSRFVLLYGGVAYLVAVRNSGARAYTIPVGLLCRLMELSGVDAREAARRTGVATKTVSYSLRALEVLGCPGPGCLLMEGGACQPANH